MELILKYFPDLTEEQKRQFAALYDLYTCLLYRSPSPRDCS